MIFPFTDDKIMCNQLSPTNRKRCQTHHVGCYLVLIIFPLSCYNVYRMGDVYLLRIGSALKLLLSC